MGTDANECTIHNYQGDGTSSASRRPVSQFAKQSPQYSLIRVFAMTLSSRAFDSSSRFLWQKRI
jgi:hypothetical protein